MLAPLVKYVTSPTPSSAHSHASLDYRGWDGIDDGVSARREHSVGANSREPHSGIKTASSEHHSFLAFTSETDATAVDSLTSRS